MHTRKHHSHFLFRALLALGLSTTLLRGQTDSVELDHSIVKGAWALQFSISSNFTLNSFKGAMLSAKYHLSATEAIRFGVTGDLSFYSTGGSYSSSETRNGQSFELVSEYLFYSRPRKEIFLFWGVGPIVQFARSHSERLYSSSSTTQVNQSWALGPSAVLGVEWFATKWLSLHAEYGLSALYIRSKTSSEYRFSNNQPVQSSYEIMKRWSLHSSPVRFGVSVYL